MKTRDTMAHTIILKIGLSERQSLDQTAHVLGVSMSKIIRDLINSYMGDYVRHYEYKIAKLTHPDHCTCPLCNINKLGPEVQKIPTHGLSTDTARSAKGSIKDIPQQNNITMNQSPSRNSTKALRNNQKPRKRS